MDRKPTKVIDTMNAFERGNAHRQLHTQGVTVKELVLASIMLAFVSSANATPPDCERLSVADGAILTQPQLQARYCDASKAREAATNAKIDSIVAHAHASTKDFQDLMNAYARGGIGVSEAKSAQVATDRDSQRREALAQADIEACISATSNIEKIAKEKGTPIVTAKDGGCKK